MSRADDQAVHQKGQIQLIQFGMEKDGPICNKRPKKRTLETKPTFSDLQS